MRLCFIANESIHTRRLVRYYVGREHEVHLVSFGEAHVAMPSEVILHRLPAWSGPRKLRWPRWALAVRRLVREIRPDILHAHQIATAGWLGAAAGYHPFVATAWGSDLMVGARSSRAQRHLARWVVRRADYVTCVSQELARMALELGARPERLAVAPWGVDVGVFHPSEDRQALRERLGLGGRPIVLSARSIRPVYRSLDIAQAIPSVLQAVPDTRFVIRTHNSDPRLLSQFQAHVREGGAESAVEYVGHLPDEEAIADLYRAADVVVSVPSSDGTPSSVLEALACGAVPVVSDVPSLREWVEDGKQALIVPVGDVQAIASAIERLLTDEQVRREMAQHGIQLVRDRLDSSILMRRNEELYESLVSPSRLSAR